MTLGAGERDHLQAPGKGPHSSAVIFIVLDSKKDLRERARCGPDAHNRSPGNLKRCSAEVYGLARKIPGERPWPERFRAAPGSPVRAHIATPARPRISVSPGALLRGGSRPAAGRDRGTLSPARLFPVLTSPRPIPSVRSRFRPQSFPRASFPCAGPCSCALPLPGAPRAVRIPRAGGGSESCATSRPFPFRRLPAQAPVSRFAPEGINISHISAADMPRFQPSGLSMAATASPQ